MKSSINSGNLTDEQLSLINNLRAEGYQLADKINDTEATENIHTVMVNLEEGKITFKQAVEQLEYIIEGIKELNPDQPLEDMDF